MPVAKPDSNLCPDCLRPDDGPHQDWCPMNSPTADEIVATYDKRAAAARKATPGGVLNRLDVMGIMRTVANIHGVTAERVRDLVEARYG